MLWYVVLVVDGVAKQVIPWPNEKDALKSAYNLCKSEGIPYEGHRNIYKPTKQSVTVLQGPDEEFVAQVKKDVENFVK